MITKTKFKKMRQSVAFIKNSKLNKYIQINKQKNQINTRVQN